MWKISLNDFSKSAVRINYHSLNELVVVWPPTPNVFWGGSLLREICVCTASSWEIFSWAAWIRLRILVNWRGFRDGYTERKGKKSLTNQASWEREAKLWQKGKGKEEKWKQESGTLWNVENVLEVAAYTRKGGFFAVLYILEVMIKNTIDH